jgi:hypothetical protein
VVAVEFELGRRPPEVPLLEELVVSSVALASLVVPLALTLVVSTPPPFRALTVIVYEVLAVRPVN